ncbi:MAG: aromatic aminobenezylarsenical efflux permease ArsG family transporter [Candidatus Micrarchaeota archaeon]
MELMQFMQDMASNDISILAAFFIGLMAAISPCPLATNITAIAYISKNLEGGTKIILSGLSYTFGRMLAYVSIAALIVYFGMNVMGISMLLQSNAELLLGSLLLISGLVMLEYIKLGSLKLGGQGFEKMKEQLVQKGYFGSFALGFLFAMAFCPFSAVLYFGMLIPLALNASDAIFIPASFSLATGLPVLVAALAFTQGASMIGKYLGKIQMVEKGVRKFAGMVFVLAGIYYLIQLVI